MRIQEALRKVRRMGFSTVKEDGTWYISKPYHTAKCLVPNSDGAIIVAYLTYDNGTIYQPFESLEA